MRDEGSKKVTVALAKEPIKVSQIGRSTTGCGEQRRGKLAGVADALAGASSVRFFSGPTGEED